MPIVRYHASVTGICSRSINNMGDLKVCVGLKDTCLRHSGAWEIFGISRSVTKQEVPRRFLLSAFITRGCHDRRLASRLSRPERISYILDVLHLSAILSGAPATRTTHTAHLRALLRLIVGQVVNLAPSLLHCFAMLQAHTDLPTAEVGACTTEAALGSLRDLRGVLTRLGRSRF